MNVGRIGLDPLIRRRIRIVDVGGRRRRRQRRRRRLRRVECRHKAGSTHGPA